MHCFQISYLLCGAYENCRTANLVPRAIFRLPLTAKRCAGDKVAKQQNREKYNYCSNIYIAFISYTKPETTIKNKIFK